MLTGKTLEKTIIAMTNQYGDFLSASRDWQQRYRQQGLRPMHVGKTRRMIGVIALMKRSDKHAQHCMNMDRKWGLNIVSKGEHDQCSAVAASLSGGGDICLNTDYRH